jgi:hypothetical protein
LLAGLGAVKLPEHMAQFMLLIRPLIGDDMLSPLLDSQDMIVDSDIEIFLTKLGAIGGKDSARRDAKML